MIPTIDGRNKADALNQEHLLWRAVCHSGPSLKPYLSPDAAIMLPGGRIVSNTTSPNLDQVLEKMPPWRSYHFEGEPHFTAVDMMSTAMSYTVTLEDGEGKKSRAVVTTVWRQGADGEWLACIHNCQIIG